MKEIDLAYLAGIVDGEGSIVARSVWVAGKSTHPAVVCRMRVFNTNRMLIDWIGDNFDGRIYHGKQYPNQKTVWTWETKSLAARTLCQQLLPYLKIKKRHAEILVELTPLISKPGAAFRKGIPEENVPKRQKLVDEIVKLNRRGRIEPEQLTIA